MVTVYALSKLLVLISQSIQCYSPFKSTCLTIEGIIKFCYTAIWHHVIAFKAEPHEAHMYSY